MYEQAISILNVKCYTPKFIAYLQNYNSKDLEMWVEKKLSSIWSNEVSIYCSRDTDVFVNLNIC